jgi:hypothetical protein
MSSVASPGPPPLLVLLPVVASFPPLSPKEPLLLPLLLPPPLLLALPLEEELSPPCPESPRSNPELPHPIAIAAPQVAKDAQRSHLRTNAPPRLAPARRHKHGIKGGGQAM